MSQLPIDDNDFPIQKDLLNESNNPNEGDNPPPTYYTQAEVDILVENSKRPYKVYTAILNQAASGNPTIQSILENTLGFEISWTYYSDGWWISNSNVLFKEEKTIAFCQLHSGGGSGKYVSIGRAFNFSTDTWIDIRQRIITTGALTNGFQRLQVEIRVYE